jgi:CO/xanthine dehydrogenase FAD-binding subunit
VTQSEIARSELVRQNVPLLAETARRIGHPLVRNRGTIGGSLSHCDPASDLCATSLALDAEITLVRYDGIRRKVQAQDFLTGTFETALGKGEILEKVSIPIPPKNSGYSFRKFTVGHGDFPLVVVSVLLRIAGEKCISAAIALGGVADHVIRAPRAEEILTRRESLQDEAVEGAVAAAVDASQPSSDLEVSAVYKKRLVGVLVRRAIVEAAERGGGARQFG